MLCPFRLSVAVAVAVAAAVAVAVAVAVALAVAFHYFPLIFAAQKNLNVLIFYKK